MTALRGILTRELQAVFFTPLGWIALGAFTLVASLLFWLELLSFEVMQQRAMALGDPALLSLLDFNDLLIGSVLLHAHVLLIFVVPLLTMRLFADEERQGTLDMLLAAPVRTSTIVAGKLLGVAVVVVAAALLLLVYPALLAWLGRAAVEGDAVVDWAQVVLGVAGVVATGVLYGAIGAAISASTSSPTTAGLLSALLLVGLWFVGGAAGGLEGSGGAVLAWLAPTSHMERLTRGVLTVADAGYYFIGTLAFAMLSARLLEARRRR
jgi:ABC-2 type transport system permease protein